MYDIGWVPLLQLVPCGTVHRPHTRTSTSMLAGYRKLRVPAHRSSEVFSLFLVSHPTMAPKMAARTYADVLRSAAPICNRRVPLGFFDLPADIRLVIYELVLKPHRVSIGYNDKRDQPVIAARRTVYQGWPQPQLLQVCKQIKTEATDFLYSPDMLEFRPEHSMNYSPTLNTKQLQCLPVPQTLVLHLKVTSGICTLRDGKWKWLLDICD